MVKGILLTSSLLLLLPVRTLGASGSSSSSREDDESATFMTLLAQLIPEQHEICLESTALLGVCASENFAIRVKEAIEVCALANIAFDGSVEVMQ